LDERNVAFARLFQSVREGVYIGTLGASSTSTLAANPHLKAIFGYPPDAAESIVQPFEAARFVDPQARQGFIELLDRDGGVMDHLIRSPPRRRRADSGLKSRRPHPICRCMAARRSPGRCTSKR
jgi:PAS domain-containing protein